MSARELRRSRPASRLAPPHRIARVKATVRRLARLPRRAIVHYRQVRRASEGPPIFVIGCPRSGTTLLRQILDSHTRIACPGETWFLCGLLEQLRRDSFRHGLQRLGVGREDAARCVRELALHYFESYLYREGKARWADKTPGYVEYCPEILDVFGPDVRFVYLLRNGLDVVNSMQDRRWMTLIAPGAQTRFERLLGAARYWIRVTEAFAAFQARHPSVCHTVRFEELTADPEPVVRGVLEFVGERWEPAILDYHAFPHSGGGDDKTAKHRGIRPNSGNYQSWDAAERRAITGMLAPHLAIQGYGEAVAPAR